MTVRTKAFALVPLVVGVLAFGVSTAAAAGTTTPILNLGVISTPKDGNQAPGGLSVGDEIDPLSVDADADDDGDGAIVDRTIGSGRPAVGNSAHAGLKAKSNPELQLSFDGLNFNQQRFANGGNQFSVEPPDQALCVGNGFVVEALNDVFRVFHTDGTPATPVIDLNTRFGYIPAINRATGARGPSITDPVCYFDRPTQRFFLVVLTLDHVGTTATTSGKNHFDILVSNTSDPTGDWTHYSVPTQNDGTDGTPNHGCKRRVSGVLVGAPCLADFPHIGADRNGIYITSNEFNFFSSGGGFIAADIYALPKAALVSGAFSLPVTLIETRGANATVTGTPETEEPGFTVWPAITPGSQYSDDAGGTEYFLSSRAVFTEDDTSDSIVTWALSNTSSLNSTPDLHLDHALSTVDEYGRPARSVQKVGSTPLADCLAIEACALRTLGVADPFTEVEGKLDSSDSRFLGVTYANGKLWGVLGTAVTVDSANLAGIAWFVLKPSNAAGLTSTLSNQGTTALANTNLTYPTIAVTPSGRGVIGFTIVGPADYPSAGYAGIDANTGAGAVHVIAAGAGPQDGFTEYRGFANPPAFIPRPRWGDYGAAAADGNSIWVASEYIGQTCTIEEYNVAGTAFGTCGGTRAPLGNWDTRISKLNP